MRIQLEVEAAARVKAAEASNGNARRKDTTSEPPQKASSPAGSPAAPVPRGRPHPRQRRPHPHPRQ
eukprot:3337804-Prymnesium_polylepis.3